MVAWWDKKYHKSPTKFTKKIWLCRNYSKL